MKVRIGDFKLLERLRQKRFLTAERPSYKAADVLARYGFATPYCKGKKVLDIGCGMGFGVKYIAKKGASSVLAIDNNKNTIDYVSSKNRLPKVRFKYFDALEIGKIGRKFDVILAFEIIEHLPVEKVASFIEALYSVLRDKGVLIVTTPNRLRSRQLFGGPYNPYHVKEYTGDELRQIIKSRYKDIQVMGIRLKNETYRAQQEKVERSFIFIPIYILGHFKFVRELVAYIPAKIKKIVTREKSFPTLKVDDFELTKNWRECEGLFVVAKKGSR